MNFNAETQRRREGFTENALYSNLPVYRDCYAVMLEFAKMRSELPRDTRYTIAQDLSRVLVDMMVTIYRANSSRNEKVRLIAEMRRKAVEVQIYFRLLSDMHQLGTQKAAFFMEKVVSIGKQLAAWHKSSLRGPDATGRVPPVSCADSFSNGAEPSSLVDGRPECVGSRPGAASHKMNPMNGRSVAPLPGHPICGQPSAGGYLRPPHTAAKGGLTENTEVTP